VRLVQVTIPAGKREVCLDALDERGIDYVVTDETSGREFDALVSFPLPTNAVEPVLGDLRDVGIDEDAYTVVMDAETVISDRFEALQEEYTETEEDEDRIASAELRTQAAELAPSTSTYVVMTVVSAVIATAGLLLDSAAVVVGSMVIAPYIGPAMSTSVGTVLGDRDLFSRGLKLQVLGILLSVASAAVFAWLVKTLFLIPPGIELTEIGELSERLYPDFLSLAVALGAGIAGVLSLSAGVSAALVGVMIAVALIPPAAAAGIGIAFFRPGIVAGSGVLVLVNALSINLSALVVLWYRGYRPEDWFRIREIRSQTYKRVGVLVMAIALLSVFLGGVTYTAYDNGVFEQNARNAIESELEGYPNLTLLSFEVQYGQQVLFQNPQRVIVTIGRPPDESATPPDFPKQLQRQVRQATDQAVALQVVYQTTAVVGADEPVEANESESGAPQGRMNPDRGVYELAPR
jgi:uncharacterized hydrophobic protein (TIGR00341 family)